MKRFTGLGVAMVTPFKNDCSIDFKSLERITNHIIEGGADYLVLLGTTSEASTLSRDEKDAILSYVVEINNRRVPLVVGMGGNNTQLVVDNIKSTDFDEIDGILTVTPYYNKPGQKGIYQHFKAIATACPVPVILYNVPGRTSSNIEAATCVKLASDFDNIVAVKEASGDFKQVMEILRDAPEDFTLLSGDDLLALPILSLGGSGVISVLGNALPGEWSEMITLAKKEKFRHACDLHYKYMDLIHLVFEDGNPAGIKSVLSHMGLCINAIRLPLTITGRQTSSRIASMLDDLKLR